MNFRIRTSRHSSFGPSGLRFLSRHFTIGRSGLLLKGKWGSIWLPTRARSAKSTESTESSFHPILFSKYMIKLIIMLWPGFMVYYIHQFYYPTSYHNYLIARMMVYLTSTVIGIAIFSVILYFILTFPSRWQRKTSKNYQFID